MAMYTLIIRDSCTVYISRSCVCVCRPTRCRFALTGSSMLTALCRSLWQNHPWQNEGPFCPRNDHLFLSLSLLLLSSLPPSLHPPPPGFLFSFSLYSFSSFFPLFSAVRQQPTIGTIRTELKILFFFYIPRHDLSRFCRECRQSPRGLVIC